MAAVVRSSCYPKDDRIFLFDYEDGTYLSIERLRKQLIGAIDAGDPKKLETIAVTYMGEYEETPMSRELKEIDRLRKLEETFREVEDVVKKATIPRAPISTTMPTSLFEPLLPNPREPRFYL
jgi:hypothetical protein